MTTTQLTADRLVICAAIALARGGVAHRASLVPLAHALRAELGCSLAVAKAEIIAARTRLSAVQS